VKVLVLGSGGREHALAWRLRRDPEVSDLLVAPGNPGTESLGTNIPLSLAAPADALALAARESVDLTVVGPEAPLEIGIADLFRSEGRPIVGPSRKGAALECSKAFAKDFMNRHGIPTARFVVCDTVEQALDAVSGRTFGFPVVVKADGLAAGKGVTIAADLEQAQAAVRGSMEDKLFGAAGTRLVIEECLTGPEVSFFVIADGTRAVPLGTAQDHKRIHDDDLGPNTGGMGAFAPSPLVSDELAELVMRDVVARVLDGMRAEGDPYRGFLYVSLMLTADGPKVIEFNVRFGDPEAQVVLPLVEGPFAKLLLASATAGVDRVPVQMGRDKTVGVVLASKGYPSAYESGRAIAGLERAAALPGVEVFHAGTRRDHGRLVTAGGRVLTVVGRAETYRQAMSMAYEAVSHVHFDGVQFRGDIGRKAVSSEGSR